MVRTILFLLLTLISVPLSIIYLDVPFSDKQWSVIEVLIKLYLFMAVFCFVVGELTKNVSQVDKLWSIMPIIYSWIMVIYGDGDLRLLIMALLVCCWGIRLSYNFHRKGGYSWIPWRGEEDYRWAVLRSKPPLNNKSAWTLFHLFFICLYQQGLILLFTLPMLIAYEGIGKSLSWFDYSAGCLFICFLIIETVADQQQYNFQNEKYKRESNGVSLDEYAHGFVRTGLWSIVRHPNYAAEQLIWVSFYLFSLSASERMLNWSISGCILLMMLFLGSSDFSEKISSQKYKEYAGYQKRVPRFWPLKLNF